MLGSPDFFYQPAIAAPGGHSGRLRNGGSLPILSAGRIPLFPANRLRARAPPRNIWMAPSGSASASVVALIPGAHTALTGSRFPIPARTGGPRSRPELFLSINMGCGSRATKPSNVDVSILFDKQYPTPMRPPSPGSRVSHPLRRPKTIDPPESTPTAKPFRPLRVGAA
jgi:hypothetical protein